MSSKQQTDQLNIEQLQETITRNKNGFSTFDFNVYNYFISLFDS